ncbi:MAG: ABC transporter ATP-binding protein, partial [Phyllobacteriaceae bacterium]|nr:ABC transporter ATP-binding protein [Phyllobacteriaceae bacterium]
MLSLTCRRFMGECNINVQPEPICHMWLVLKIFFKAEGTRPLLVLFCLLVGGTLEAVGVGALLPVISTLMNTQGGGGSSFESTLRAGMDWLGLSSDFVTLLAISVTFLLLRALLLFGAMTYSGITGARVANRLRTRLIKAIFDARWSYYSDQSSGHIASVISNDASRAGEAYNLSAIAAANSIQIIAYTVVALLINWRVALVAILGGLVIATASQKIIKISRKAGYKQSDRTAMLTSDMVDLVQNMKSLKAMHRYDPMIAGLAELVKRLRRALYVQNLARFGMVYGNDVMMVLIVAVAAWFAIKVAHVPVEHLLVIGILFFQVMSYMSKFLKQVQAASLVDASYLRTQEMIAGAEAQKEPLFGTLAPPERADFHFRDVSFSHGEKPILKDVTLTIPANRITVLRGPSGAGKTTLIDLLIGLH